MKRICAWCSAPIGSPDTDDQPGIITHGICRECIDKHFGEARRSSIREMLERLPAPVFLVSGEGRILAANARASRILGKEHAEIENELGGDAFECAYADLPGGCGQTDHCKTCAIRLTVTDSHETGRSHEGVEAYQDIRTPRGVRRTRFLISTQKVAGSVLLRIDEVGS